MLGKLELFKLAHGLATHANARQTKISANIANVDTPGYKAQDIRPFAESYRAPNTQNGLRATRAGHSFSSQPGQITIEPIVRTSGKSPNGNSVSIESEMVEAAEVRQAHDLALTVYQSALGIMRSSIRNR